MATKNLPDWAERIPSIRAALTKIPTELFDRRQIGELFGVTSYEAGRLIRDMGPMLHGNSHVVDTEDIRKMLSEVQRAKGNSRSPMSAGRERRRSRTGAPEIEDP